MKGSRVAAAASRFPFSSSSTPSTFLVPLLLLLLLLAPGAAIGAHEDSTASGDADATSTLSAASDTPTDQPAATGDEISGVMSILPVPVATGAANKSENASALATPTNSAATAPTLTGSAAASSTLKPTNGSASTANSTVANGPRNGLNSTFNGNSSPGGAGRAAGLPAAVLFTGATLVIAMLLF